MAVGAGAKIVLSLVLATGYDWKILSQMLENDNSTIDSANPIVYNGDMKDNYSTLNITLPLFIVGSFIIICFGSALGIMIQHFCLGGI